MDLLIYSPSFQLLGIVDTYLSLRWRRRFFGPGEAELHCLATTEALNLLVEGNVIHRTDRAEAVIIEGVTIQSTDQGDKLTVTGQMGSSMLAQRIVTPAIDFNGTTEAAMRQLVYNNAITGRPITGLALGTLAGYAVTCTGRASQGKTVLSVLEALGRAAPLGFRTRFNAAQGRWSFEAYDGVDRTVRQTVRPYVVFSSEYGNINDAVYTHNVAKYKNYAYVAGAGEGESRIVVTVDQTGGKPRRELWVDARDLQQGELTAEAYRTLLTQRGIEKLAAAAAVENFEAGAIDTANYRYIEDWNLGDIVSFEQWGILLHQRITEVEEVHEGGITTIKPVCGNPLPESINLGGD